MAEPEPDNELLRMLTGPKWKPCSTRGLTLKKGDRIRVPWPKKDALLTGSADAFEWREGTLDGKVVRLDVGGAPVPFVRSTCQVLK